MNVPTVPRVPLPSTEPVPAQEPYEDQRAGELGIGSYSADRWRAKPIRRRRKLPFGFCIERAE